MHDQRKTLLILGSMDEFALLVQRAKERGCRVLVADGYEHGPARAHADASFTIPVTDTEALVNLCRDEAVDALITSFSDVLFEEGCRVAHAAGLPAPCSLDKLEFLRNKQLMKNMFDQLGVPYPNSCVVPLDQVERACESLRFPCVIKPVDAYGSYGVRVVRTAVEAIESAASVAEESRRANSVVLEEYNGGHEFNMITWASHGRVFPVSVADREKTVCAFEDLPHVSRIVYPSRFTDEVLPDALAYAQRIVEFAGIEHGPLCMQFFWSPDSGIHVCEVTGRVFGYEHELLEYASGLSVEDLLLDTALDRDALARRLEAHDARSMPKCSCGLYFHARDGIVASLDAAQAALQGPCVQETLLYYAPGQTVKNARGGQPYAARAFLAAESYGELDAASARMFENFSIADPDGKDLAVPNRLPSACRASQASETTAKEQPVS
ncbi:ATP-grasp domain-containing protein [Paraeggerthella hongkongensis]|uniref:ATP-grasp domain-containing protein n=1 Tax=Paraeggerthella hominis TaxID=2897351 RepID=UPI001C123A19|nr:MULTISPECIES: ATP-grasp domain-containing protein [Paraeggerthella]MBU5404503.1 ATP-grasp domain-containing protein [Paraeggerthella hongkongensis]MCD2432198.1 ATP-grasp domain-containing protein [Paraeggerthella hominis]